MLNTLFSTQHRFSADLCTSRRLDPSILREYDIRGIVDDTLTCCDAHTIGIAFGHIVRQNNGKRVVIARDGRLHSQSLYEALADGLRQAGINVISIGLAPTPMLYFGDRVFETDGAIMITGSHNPAEFNGFKMVLNHKPFFGQDIQKLGKLATSVMTDPLIGWYSHVDLSAMYLEVLSAMTIHRPLKVAWDPGNGASGEILTKLVPLLPGSHIIINGHIDGTFPNHHPDPTIEENLQQLQSLVKRENCDLGIAFDGDGDRIGVVDNEGHVVWGDQILSLLAEDVLQHSPGATIIADVKSSQALFDHIKQHGGTPVMWKTGHSLIKSKIMETGALLAGEMSGHIFFADRYYGYDDALYTAVRLLETLSKRDQPLSDYRKSLPKRHNTPEIRINCPDEDKFAKILAIQKSLYRSHHTVSMVDGVRVHSEDGWWLLRASNTQPALVARCESLSQEGLHTLKTTLVDLLTSVGIQPPPALAV